MLFFICWMFSTLFSVICRWSIVKGQIVNSFGFVGYTISVATIQFWYRSIETVIDYVEISRHCWVLKKTYLQKQEAGWIWDVQNIDLSIPPNITVFVLKQESKIKSSIASHKICSKSSEILVPVAPTHLLCYLI